MCKELLLGLRPSVIKLLFSFIFILVIDLPYAACLKECVTDCCSVVIDEYKKNGEKN